jgi:hypothetical protein
MGHADIHTTMRYAHATDEEPTPHGGGGGDSGNWRQPRQHGQDLVKKGSCQWSGITR